MTDAVPLFGYVRALIAIVIDKTCKTKYYHNSHTCCFSHVRIAAALW